MITYVSYSTFTRWVIDLRKEIKIRMIKSGSKITMEDYFPIQNRMTRKHIGFEFSSTENGKPFYRIISKNVLEPDFAKESVMQIKIVNQKKFTSFMFKYSKNFDFLENHHIMM